MRQKSCSIWASMWTFHTISPPRFFVGARMCESVIKINFELRFSQFSVFVHSLEFVHAIFSTQSCRIAVKFCTDVNYNPQSGQILLIMQVASLDISDGNKTKIQSKKGPLPVKKAHCPSIFFPGEENEDNVFSGKHVHSAVHQEPPRLFLYYQ